jgi:hypothetical protein
MPRTTLETNIPRSRPKPIGPGISMNLPATLRARDLNGDQGGVDVEMELDLTDDGVRPVAITVRSPNGRAVTGADLRAVRVYDLVRVGIASGVLWNQKTEGGDVFVVGGLDEYTVKEIRNDGPVDKSLEWVGRIYELAKVLGLPPAQRVELELGLTRRTATNWIRRARERGFLTDDPAS